ncbi:hypothetical protein KJ682_12210 [bacterium]|nr:hypothetical protein [bacterium]
MKAGIPTPQQVSGFLFIIGLAAIGLAAIPWTTLAGDIIPAVTDTLDLYGGPGTLEGKFQDAAGDPDPQGWTPIDDSPNGTGNYGHLWMGLDDADPDQDNPTPQWAFLDDGKVVGCSGPSYCTAPEYCYGPDELVTNQTGGCLGGMATVQASVLSPVIELPKSDGYPVLSFDVYLHNGPFPFDDPLGMVFNLELTADPDGLSGWTPFSDDFIHAGITGKYERITFPVPEAEVPAGTTLARIRLTAYEMPMGFLPGDSSPAPYFDNVRLQWVPSELAPAPIPASTLTASAHPNPFNPSVTIQWSAPEGAAVTVRVHDLAGRLVTELFDGRMGGQEGSAVWDGRDSSGRAVATGMYLCLIECGSDTRLLKLTMMK